MIVVGVDAGASHTEVGVAGLEGPIIARRDGPPGATGPGRGRAETAARAIAETVTLALESHGAPGAITVGAAGAGNEDERHALEQALVAALGMSCPLAVTTDAHVALDAAFSGEAGIVIVAGTGSVALARDPARRLRRTGGYGPHIGDDAGAYSLVRDALGRAARGHDRRDPHATALLHRLLRAQGFQQFDQVVRWVQAAGYAETAALAAAVTAAAADGDETANAAVSACASRLAELAVPLAKPFAPDDPAVAMGGGLLGGGSTMRAAVCSALTAALPNAAVREQPVDPLVGAVWKARRLVAT